MSELVVCQDELKKALEMALNFTIGDMDASPITKIIGIKRICEHVVIVATDLKATIRISVSAEYPTQEDFEVGIFREEACNLVNYLNNDPQRVVVAKDGRSLVIRDLSGAQICFLDKTAKINGSVIAFSGIPDDAEFVSHVNWKGLYQMATKDSGGDAQLFFCSNSAGLAVAYWREGKIEGPIKLGEGGPKFSAFLDAQYIRKIGPTDVWAGIYHHVTSQSDWEAYYFVVFNVVLGIHSRLPEKLDINTSH